MLVVLRGTQNADVHPLTHGHVVSRHSWTTGPVRANYYQKNHRVVDAAISWGDLDNQISVIERLGWCFCDFVPRHLAPWTGVAHARSALRPCMSVREPERVSACVSMCVSVCVCKCYVVLCTCVCVSARLYAKCLVRGRPRLSRQRLLFCPFCPSTRSIILIKY